MMSAIMTREANAERLEPVREYVLSQVEKHDEVSPSDLGRRRAGYSSHDLRLAILQLVDEGLVKYSPRRKLILASGGKQEDLKLTRW